MAALGAAALVVLATSVAGQQIGTVSFPEWHLPITTEECTKAGGCSSKQKAMVIDLNWRWIHNVGGYDNCEAGGSWNPDFCPTPEECGKNCAAEGIDQTGYVDGYKAIPTKNGTGMKLVWPDGPRMYLLDNPYTYTMTHLLNREISFEVDMSALPCSLLGAMYLQEMEPIGGASEAYLAGSQYGASYCDAQCPQNRWFNGLANIEGTNGYCCAELDILEGNSMAQAFTPHPCSEPYQHICNTTETCGDMSQSPPVYGVCDKYGCGYNPYKLGSKGFWGRGKNFEVDTTRPIRIVTQFITSDGTDAGDLVEIRRLYVQDGKVISNAKTPNGDSLTDEFCAAEGEGGDDDDETKASSTPRTMTEQAWRQWAKATKKKVPDPLPTAAEPRAPPSKASATAGQAEQPSGSGAASKASATAGQAEQADTAFEALGGMKAMGEALRRGMNPTFSLWNNFGEGKMNWLDAGENGPCPEEFGTQEDLDKWQEENGPIQIEYWKIRIGELDSTYKPSCKPKEHYCDELCSKGLGYEGGQARRCARGCAAAFGRGPQKAFEDYCEGGACSLLGSAPQADESSLLQRRVQQVVASQAPASKCTKPCDLCADLCRGQANQPGCRSTCLHRFAQSVQPVLEDYCYYGLCSGAALLAEGEGEAEASLMQVSVEL